MISKCRTSGVRVLVGWEIGGKQQMVFLEEGVDFYGAHGWLGISGKASSGEVVVEFYTSR